MCVKGKRDCVSYLPVNRRILHQLVKLLLHRSLEDAGLIALRPKLAPQCRVAGVQLQEHHQVGLGKTHVRIRTPV